jgi:hypothetical protein
MKHCHVRNGVWDETRKFSSTAASSLREAIVARLDHSLPWDAITVSSYWYIRRHGSSKLPYQKSY